MSGLPVGSEDKVHHLLPANLLHELRTQLGHVLGYSELLIEEVTDSGHEEFVPHLEKIRKAARQLMVIMEENFEASRTGDGDKPA